MEYGETENYFKIHLLIYDTASCVLRKTFQEMWFDLKKKKWENTDVDGNELIVGIGKKVYSKEMRLQKDNLKSGDINKWDFPLLLKIINEFNNHLTLSVEDDEKFKSLSTLVNIRNKLSHSGASSMSDEEYETNWDVIAEVLTKFGMTERELKESCRLSKHESKATLTTIVNEENSQMAKEMKDEGNKLLQNGHIQGAIDRYSEALLLSNISIEDQAILYSNRSKAYLDLEVSDTENALEDAKQIMNLRPQWWKSYFRAAIAYEAAGDFQQAVKYYSMTLALEPTTKDIELRMSNCQFRRVFNEMDSKGIYRSVHECVETYLKKTINKNEIIRQEMIKNAKEKLKSEDSYLGLIVKGHIHRVGEKFKEAEEFFTRASVMHKMGNAEALYNLALLKIGQKLKNSNVSDGIKLLEKAAAQLSRGNDFGVAESEFILGLYYEKAIKDYNKARSFYERSTMDLNGLAANQLANMLEEGIGCMKNRESAVDFWKIAATSKQKVVFAMESLSRHYLETYDFEDANKWHAAAVENGSKVLSETKDSFKSEVDELKICHMNWRMCKLLQEREDVRQSRLPEKEKLLKIKIDVTIKRMLEDHFKYKFEDKNTPLTLGPVLASMSDGSFKSNMTIKKLREAAENGNEMSKILLETHDHYVNALHILEYENIDDELLFLSAIKEMASAISMEQSFISLSPEFCSKLWEKLKPRVPKPNSKNSEDDKNIRICYCYFNSTLDASNFDRTLFYAKESARKYPDEPYFPFMVGSMYGFKQDFSEGVRATNKALEINPNNSSLLYNKAALGMHCKYLSPEKGIKPYLEFIESAPLGHRKIPEANYTIALFYKTLHDMTTSHSNSDWGKTKEELYDNFVKYVKLGQQSERTLAPCYLPYNDNFKKDAEDAWRVFELQREVAQKSGLPKLMRE